jgi:hypothetical protein
MSVNLSSDQYESLLMRQRAKKQPDSGVNVCDEFEAFEGKEEELAQLCIAEIRRRRWYFTRNTPGRRQTATVGTVDLIIAAPNGITYWCELKNRNGKLSASQNICRHVLSALNHHHEVVSSFEQFLQFIGPS